MLEITHCSFLKCLFSTPAWLPLMRLTAVARSSGVKNQAFVGESGKRNLKQIYLVGKTYGVLVDSPVGDRGNES